MWEGSFQLKQKTLTCFKCFCQQMSTVGMSHIRGCPIAAIGRSVPACINSRASLVQLSTPLAGTLSHRASLLWTPSTPQQGHTLVYKNASLHTCLPSNMPSPILHVKSTEWKDSAGSEVRMTTTRLNEGIKNTKHEEDSPRFLKAAIWVRAENCSLSKI